MTPTVFPTLHFLRFTFISKAFLLLLLFFSAQAYSFNPVILSDDAEEVRIASDQFQVLEDPEGKLGFEKVGLEEYQKKFINPTTDLSEKVRTYFWVRFNLLNQSDNKKNWILQLPLHTDNVSIYIKSPDGSIKKFITGQNYRFDSREINLRTLAFELPPKTEHPIEVYIHLYSKKYTDLSFIISNEQRYMEVHTKGYLFLGLIYGILFLMAVYNFILFISIKEKIYIYYVLYTLSAAFFISWKDSLGFQFIWPNIPVINGFHYEVGLFLLLITFMLYANDFLELRKKYPKLYYATYGIIAVNFIYFLLNLFNADFFDPLPVLYILSYLYFFCITLYYIIHHFKPARYLFISLICIICALTVIKLRYMSLLGWNWFIEYILNYAVALEAITMSLAISDKLSYLRKQEAKVREIKLIEEKLKIENAFIHLNNKHLEEEAKHTNNELALLATNLAQKNEFFHQFKKEIQLLLKETPENGSLQKLVKNLDKEVEFENDWDLFQLNFDKQHHNFLYRLREKFPNLKPSDLLLCAYIKLYKSNKEIATLLNITVSGVEKKRTRLKEKMQLDSDETLSDFILKLK